MRSDASGDCGKCGAELERVLCDVCDGDGLDPFAHECGEDCCNCLDPAPNVPCDVCRGLGGWWVCSRGEDCRANSRHVAATILRAGRARGIPDDSIRAQLDRASARTIARVRGVSRRTARRARTYARRLIEVGHG